MVGILNCHVWLLKCFVRAVHALARESAVANLACAMLVTATELVDCTVAGIVECVCVCCIDH